MEILIARAKDGAEYTAALPLELETENTLDVPADLFRLTLDNKHGRISGLFDRGDTILISDGGNAIMDGVVDNAFTTLDGTGLRVRLDGRSRVARLLDNQAMPQYYSCISMKDFIEALARPFGFTKFDVADKTLNDVYIERNTSVWDAIYNTVYGQYGYFPHLSPDGMFICKTLAPRDQPALVLSNYREGAVRYLKLRHTRSTVGLVTEVWAKREGNGRYPIKVCNPDLHSERFGVRVYHEEPIQSRRTLETAAQKLLSSSRHGKEEITLELRLNTAIRPGLCVAVTDKACAIDGLFCVVGVSHRLSNKGALTSVRVWPFSDLY